MSSGRNNKKPPLPSVDDALRNIDMEKRELAPLHQTQPGQSRASSHRLHNEISSSLMGGSSRESSSANASGSSNSGNLRHDRSSSRSSAPSNLTCPICQKTFQRTSDAKKHIKTVHGPKEFQCSVCGMQFGRKDYKQKHERSQHNVIPTPSNYQQTRIRKSEERKKQAKPGGSHRK